MVWSVSDKLARLSNCSVVAIAGAVVHTEEGSRPLGASFSNRASWWDFLYIHLKNSKAGVKLANIVGSTSLFFAHDPFFVFNEAEITKLWQSFQLNLNRNFARVKWMNFTNMFYQQCWALWPQPKCVEVSLQWGQLFIYRQFCVTVFCVAEHSTLRTYCRQPRLFQGAVFVSVLGHSLKMIHFSTLPSSFGSFWEMTTWTKLDIT